MSQATKANSTLERFSDGALCHEKWLALLHTHTIQLVSLQCTRFALRIPLLSRLTHHSTHICYICSIKLYIYDCPNFIAPLLCVCVPAQSRTYLLLLLSAASSVLLCVLATVTLTHLPTHSSSRA